MNRLDTFVKTKVNRVMNAKLYILIFLCIAVFSFNLAANEVIKFTWTGGNKTIYIETLNNTQFTINWGDDSVDTILGNGGWQNHIYNDTDDYFVTITCDSTDCLFTKFYCGSNNVSSLDLNMSKNLTSLYCSYNQLTSLDLSTNTNLISLDCDNNQLISLNLSTNTALLYLSCNNNLLNRLDLSTNTVLEGLNCSNNQLNRLSLNGNNSLNYLNCYDNQLNRLSLNENSTLTELNCSNNQLNNIELGENIALMFLYCNDNLLKNLDLTGNTALRNLDCSNNQLTVLGLKANTALEYLTCYRNRLTILDINANTTLYNISCSDNQLTFLDVSTNELFCSNNHLCVLIINSALKKLYCDNNCLQLSNLYAASLIVTITNRYFGTQTLPTQAVKIGEKVDFSSQTKFNSIATVFEIQKDNLPATLGSDYNIKDGVITFKQNGRYIVTMTNSAIVSPSFPATVIATFEVGTVGINEIVQTPIFKIYPNPATNIVYIKTENEIVPEVKLYSIEGKLLQHIRSTEIDISPYSAGVYFIQIDNKTKKLIKL